MSRILLADDEPIIRGLLKKELRSAGYEVVAAADGQEALEAFLTKEFSAVILDVNMPKMDGFYVLKKMRQYKKDLIIIMITAYGSVESAVKAMKLGADDYIPKPFEGSDLVEKVDRLLRIRQREDIGKKPVQEKDDQLIGTGQAMELLRSRIQKIKDSNVTVLITGESGTGKNVVARQLHFQSIRKEKPFVHVNCAALPDNLMESELFGYEKGAFTGASAAKPGKFELAEDGTIFLDEISTLSLRLQPKLLSVLQEKYFERVGGNKKIPMRARIVAATNEDLEHAVEKNKFREDLFYRLNVVRLDCPPLRTRSDDIQELISAFLNRFIQESEKQFYYIEPEIWRAMSAYSWPGNVRQMENVLQSLVLLADEPNIFLKDLPKQIRDCVKVASVSNGLTLRDQEIEAILAALENHHGHREKTAEQLGISRRALQYKLKEYGLLDLAESKPSEEIISTKEDTSENIDQTISPKVFLRTFGRFDVFIDGKLVDFSNAKAKELLALCTDRVGGEVTMAEAIDKLWEMRAYDERSKNLYRKAVSYLKQVFLEYGCCRVFESGRGRCHINQNHVICDYYQYIRGEDIHFGGEYLFDYSWGEETLAKLMFQQDRHRG